MQVRFMNPEEISHVREVINNDPEFRLASRFFSKDILLVVGESKCLVNVRDGVITEIKLEPTFMNPWNFFIRGSVEAWQKFLQSKPPPFFTDLYGGIARKNFELGGDIEAAFAHFWPLTRMLDLMRQLQNEEVNGAT
jgi:hypothetical protein